ncbi:MAG: hypothetical protein K2P51_00250 [Rhabdochlamydiaceae bacterium]|nr:hypothetical protein [Rhabdochlamydiaceae bacterium]
MRTANVLFSAVQLIFVVTLFLLGGLFLGLAHAPHFRNEIAQFFLSDTTRLMSIGYVILGVAALLFFGFYAMNRSSFFQVEMHSGRFDVDPSVIQNYVQCYWNDIFPDYRLDTQIVIRRGKKIEILAEMPEMADEELTELLTQIENELSCLLEHSLGYRSEFLVTVTHTSKKSLKNSL